MKKYCIVILFLAVTFSSADEKLIVGKDGHEERIGQNDGHDVDHSPILGKPDGHEIYQKIDNGGLKGKDGQESHHSIDNGGLIGRPDGHEMPQIIDKGGLVGKPDGHERGRHTEVLYNHIVKKIKKFKIMVGGHDGIDMPKTDAQDKGYFNNDESSEVDSDDVDDGNAAEEELVRCKRPMCNETLSCAFGSKTDHKGCNICECLKDPCVGHSCEVGYACDIEECIHGRRCNTLGFKCIRKVCRGPTPMCANRCEFGYAVNEGGCDTCICRLPPPEDAKIDDGGIKVVSDDDDDEEKIDDDYEEEDEGHEDFNHIHFKTIPFDPKAASCGFKCRKSHFCDTVQKDCKMRTKCWLQIEHRELFGSASATCDPIFWKYQPLQCTKGTPRKCWCVDVIGRMVPASLTTVVNQEQEPICKEKLISSVTMVLDLVIVGEGTGKGRLNNLIVKAISDISTARKIDIDLLMELVKHDRLRYHVTFKYSNKYDLGYAVEAIRLSSQLTFNSEDLKVIQRSPAKMGEVVEYAESRQGGTIDIPLNEFFAKKLHSMHLMSSHRSSRLILLTSFIVMSTSIILLLFLMAHRLYKRRGGIRHQPLPSNLPSTLDPSNLLRSPVKNDKVLLVDHDDLDRARVA